MGRIGIKDIRPLSYEGYLWWSDRRDPEVFDGESVALPQEGANPFVAEGMLYNAEEGLSYSIRYVDGDYLVYEHVVSPADQDSPVNEEKVYESNRMDGRKLCFLRYWEERVSRDNVEDVDGCDGLPVRVQTKDVFVGFKR